MTIQVLPEAVVAQIAAGEVVERPASVVKELLENALDAEATHIQIETYGGGQQRIRVSDNGTGIPASEAELAFQRHATSKLRTADDLYNIRTLGFRGEALASIASVSHITITTRHRDAQAGTVMRLEGGQVIERRGIGAPVGTILTVEDLFFNTPARLKFLKKDATEKRHIALLVTRYAMAYPHVRFVLEQDGREVFRSSGSGNLADVLVSALGLDTFKDMVEVASPQTVPDNIASIQVRGYTSAPSMHRADRTHITLFVNGRWIQDTRLAYAVTQAYHTFLMSGRYPVSVILVDLPPEEVDVNVHPTKAEVRFRDPDAVFASVQRAVRRAIVDLAQTPAIRGTGYAGLTSGYRNWEYDLQTGMNLELDSPGRFRRQHNANPESGDPTAVPYGPDAPAKPRTLPILRVIGQAGATYIVAEGPAGIYLIDQHAAHERILYEQMMDKHSRRQLLTQYALTAHTIHLPPSEAQLVEASMDALQLSGFELEPFGPNTYVIRSVPALLAEQSPTEVLMGVIADLETGLTPGQSSIEERIVKFICKRAAVKAGQILSLDEMQGLIRQLERCESPHTCPHGRPTMLHLTGEQLAREFGRLG